MTPSPTLRLRVLAWLRRHPGWRCLPALAAALEVPLFHVERAVLDLHEAHEVRWQAAERRVRAMPAEWSAPRRGLDDELRFAQERGDATLVGAVHRLIGTMEAVA